MGFRSGAYATVWGVQPFEKFSKVRLSTSRKDKQSGEFLQDFSGFCTFIGNANAKAASLKERDRIRLGDVDVTRKWDNEKKQEYINYTVFDFDVPPSGSAASAQHSAPPSQNAVDSNETDGLPF